LGLPLYKPVKQSWQGLSKSSNKKPSKQQRSSVFSSNKPLVTITVARGPLFCDPQKPRRCPAPRSPGRRGQDKTRSSQAQRTTCFQREQKKERRPHWTALPISRNAPLSPTYATPPIVYFPIRGALPTISWS
jgi:hypothetical protein